MDQGPAGPDAKSGHEKARPDGASALGSGCEERNWRGREIKDRLRRATGMIQVCWASANDASPPFSPNGGVAARLKTERGYDFGEVSSAM